MSVPLTINGVTFQYPQQFDLNWGPTLTNWSTAVTNALAPLTGGFLTLPFPTSGIVFRNSTDTANLPLTVNGSNQLTFNGIPIGATVSLTNTHIFVGNALNQPADVAMSGDATITNTGVVSVNPNLTLTSLKSPTANTATAGFIRLANVVDSISWRNFANSGNLDLVVNASDQLQFKLKAIPLEAGALLASRVVVSDASTVPDLVSSVTTTTELSYVSGVTSAIQTQLNSITTGFLPLSGGTMSGPINMGSNKITALTQGSNAGEAISFPVAAAQMASGTITTTQISGTAGITGAQLAANTVATGNIVPSAVTQILPQGISNSDQATLPGITNTITTTGGSVLILGSISITATTAGSPTNCVVVVTRAGTPVPGGMATVTYPSTFTGNYTFPIMAIDTPAAGTYTYRFSYGFSLAPTGVSVTQYSMHLIELKR